MLTSGLATAAAVAASGAQVATVAVTGLVASGWKVIGNYADLQTNQTALVSATNSDTTTLYSSYWLISAYDTTYGLTSSNGGSLSSRDDSFKVLSIAGGGCTGTVSNNKCGGGSAPEPGSLALVGMAAMGYVATRRRKLLPV